MSSLKIAALIFAFAALSPVMAATSYTFINNPTAGAAWEKDTNWTPIGVPGSAAGDTVTIPLTALNRPVINSTPAFALASLSIDGGGALVIQGGVTLTINGPLTLTKMPTIGGLGTLAFAAGSTQVFSSANQATISCNITNAGSITLNDSVLNINSFTQTAGSFVVNETPSAGISIFNATSPVGSINIQGGSMTLNGITYGCNVTNSGTFQTEVATAEIRQGNFTQTAAGTFKETIDAASTTNPNTAIKVSGTASLAGTLAITVLNGSPKLADVFYIILVKDGTVSGTFSAVTGGAGLAVAYPPESPVNTVTIKVTGKVVASKPPTFKATEKLKRVIIQKKGAPVDSQDYGEFKLKATMDITTVDTKTFNSNTEFAFKFAKFSVNYRLDEPDLVNSNADILLLPTLNAYPELNLSVGAPMVGVHVDWHDTKTLKITMVGRYCALNKPVVVGPDGTMLLARPYLLLATDKNIVQNPATIQFGPVSAVIEVTTLISTNTKDLVLKADGTIVKVGTVGAASLALKPSKTAKPAKPVTVERF